MKRTLPRLPSAVALMIVSLASVADPAPPSLQKELPVCVQRHGNAPALPAATDYPGGLSEKAGALTPAELPGVTTVSPMVVACLIESMGSELAILAPMKDVMGISEASAWPGVGLGREPTAEQKNTLDLIFDELSGGRKDRPIVVYCHHTSCFLSYNALIHLQNAGYTNLLWMREGIKGWREAGLPVGPVQMQGGEALPNVSIPKVEWNEAGNTRYPQLPNYYDKKRWEPLEAVGLKMVRVCMQAKDRTPASGPTLKGVQDAFEDSLLKAAGVDPTLDNEVAVRRKMQAFWAKYGDLLECNESFVGYRSILKHAVRHGSANFVHRAINDWKLPAEAFNKIDPADGRTLLDYVEGFANVPHEGDLTFLYRKLRKAGAMTHDELVAASKAEPIESVQAKVLAQWRSLANSGDVKAMFHLSEVYRRGTYVVVNREEGMKWWDRAGERAIETNDFPTMITIATAYYFDKDKDRSAIQANPAKAREWIVRASAGDTKETNLWMGRMYQDGVGVTRDLRRAIPYLERALELGEDTAIKWLATAWIDLGDKHKAAYYLRAWPLVQDIKGIMTSDWFEKLGVSWCGPRATTWLQDIECDGTNAKPPSMF